MSNELVKSEEMFQGVAGVIPATSVKASEKLRIAIVGKMKTGKSWFAASAPQPVLVYDFDNRAESLAGRQGVFVKTLVDIDASSPHVVQDIEADLEMFKYNKSQGKAIPATFVFDSITYFKKAIENELIKQEPTFGRKIKLAGKIVRIPAGWDVINAVRAHLEHVINEFGALGNLIFVFHQRDEKDRDRSTKEETKYTGRQTVDPQYLETILALFNEVYFIEIEYGGKYVAKVRATDELGASTTLQLEAQEEPNIMQMIEKHHKALEATNK
jgi:AAA domain